MIVENVLEHPRPLGWVMGTLASMYAAVVLASLIYVVYVYVCTCALLWWEPWAAIGVKTTAEETVVMVPAL